VRTGIGAWTPLHRATSTIEISTSIGIASPQNAIEVDAEDYSTTVFQTC
jgi:hypothetical protein